MNEIIDKGASKLQQSLQLYFQYKFAVFVCIFLGSLIITTAFPNPDPKRNRNSSDVAGGGTLRSALLRGGKIFTR